MHRMRACCPLIPKKVKAHIKSHTDHSNISNDDYGFTFINKNYSHTLMLDNKSDQKKFGVYFRFRHGIVSNREHSSQTT